MQKPTTIIFYLILAAFTAGCDQEMPKEAKNALLPKYSLSQNGDIDYISDYRRASGLYGLKSNDILALAAQNHAKYIVANDSLGHGETVGAPNFTGENVSQRTKFAGYSYLGTLENIAHKNSELSPQAAIDGLFSAIYHRFMFLNPYIDEMGYGFLHNEKSAAHVFVAGHSLLNAFCKNGVSDEGSGRFYTGFCANPALKISESKYKRYQNFNEQFIKFPSTLPVQPYFSGEEPDPFPECKITANPVSITFNSKFGEVKMQKFEIFKDGKKIESTKIIDASNDINSIFSKSQFAVFAYEPFDFDSAYTAKFSYILNGKPSVVEWDFHTKTPQIPYFDLRGGETIALEPDREYELFFRPRNCNDLSRNYTARSKNFTTSSILRSGGANTLILRLNGLKGDVVEIATDTGMRVSAVLSASSKDAAQKERRYKLIAAAFGILAASLMLFVFFRGLINRRKF